MEFTVVGHKMDPPRCPCPSLLILWIGCFIWQRNPAEVIYIIDLKLGKIILEYWSERNVVCSTQNFQCLKLDVVEKEAEEICQVGKSETQKTGTELDGLLLTLRMEEGSWEQLQDNRQRGDGGPGPKVTRNWLLLTTWVNLEADSFP